MRETEIKGFTVYNMYNRQVYQRGHILNLSREEKEKAFKEYDISIVIGLARKPDNDLMHMHIDGDILYYYFPIPDGELDPDIISVLHAMAWDVAECILGDDDVVLSYCNAGRNRSALMNAFIIWELNGGMSGEDVVKHVRKERPNALANPFFEEYLLELDQ